MLEGIILETKPANDNDSFMNVLPECKEKVPILVHPLFYRDFKLTFLLDAGSIARSNHDTRELATLSMMHSIGVFSLAAFRTGYDTS